jgi:hypothetical protein
MSWADVLWKIIKKFVGKTAKAQAKQAVQDKMDEAEPTIVAKMHAAGYEPPAITVENVTRDALFRLWRAVVPSGDLADLIRDNQEDDIKPKVKTAAGANPTLAKVVDETKKAAINLTF